MKATSLLEKQHRKAEAIFAKLEKARDGRHDALVAELADALAAHMAIEEQIFYPTVRKRLPAKGKDLVLESYEEHAAARFALERLVATSPDDETFHAKVKALKELIEDHVEEEEDDLFPLVEKHLTDTEQKALGEEMSAMNEECMAVGHTRLLTTNGSRRRTYSAPTPR